MVEVCPGRVLIFEDDGSSGSEKCAARDQENIG